MIDALTPYKDNPQERHVPANVEAEKAVIGSLFINPGGFKLIGARLLPQDFFRERYGIIYDAMLGLYNKGKAIDFVTVMDQLENKSLSMDKYGARNQLEEIGGPAELTDIMASTPTAMYVEEYANIVKDCSIRRQAIAAGGKIVESAYDAETADDVVATMHTMTSQVELSKPARRMKTAVSAAFDVLGKIEEIQNGNAPLGLPTGLTMIDRMLGGLQKSDMAILAGASGSGKTATALTIVRNAAKYSNARVVFFSLEMAYIQLMQRLMAMESGIDSHRIKMGKVNDEEIDLLGAVANKMASYDILIDDTPSASLPYITSESKRIHAEKPIDLIVVDYLQLITTMQKYDTRALQVADIARSLKSLARELDVPIMPLSQIKRTVDGRPTISDLSEGGIERDADIVMFTYREDYYDKDTEKQNIMEILLEKHRHGATGAASFYFRKELTEIRDLEIQRTEL